MNLNKLKILKDNSGFGTLEMLIAFFVLIMTITAITSLSFGGQAIAVDTETNAEALYRAQGELENFRALSRQNFLGVNTTGYDDGFYTGTTTVTDISQCLKKAVTHLTWDVEGRSQFIELSTILSDWNVVFETGDSCSIDEFDPDNWHYLGSFGSADLGQGQGTDIDVMEIDGQKIVFLATEIPSPLHDDFFAVWPPYSSDESVGLETGVRGLNALDVVYYPDLGKYYAFVAANNEDSDQFQVIDVTDYQNPALVISKDLPNVVGDDSVGRSIYYYDKKVYIGTDYVSPALSIHEFHIYDVSDPTDPVWLDSTKTANHNINKIIVRGDYAYLATSSNIEELIILNINPSSPYYLDMVGFFNAVGGEDGISLDVIGNKAYLGRDDTSSGRPNLYVLDISDPTNVTELGSAYLHNAKINDLQVRNDLAFLATDDANEELQVWDVSDPANIVKRSDAVCMNLPEIAAALDFEDDLLYVAFRSNDVLKIIYSSETCGP